MGSDSRPFPESYINPVDLNLLPRSTPGRFFQMGDPKALSTVFYIGATGYIGGPLSPIY